MTDRKPLLRDLAGPLAFAAIWFGLASVNGNVTYHLAPAVVAGAVPLRAPDRRPVRAIAGFALASAVAVTLALAGRMTGPTLLPIGGALLESVAAAALGAVAGHVATARFEASAARHPIVG